MVFHNRISSALLMTLLFLPATANEMTGQKVTNYEPCTVLCTLAVKNAPFIAIRSFSLNKEPYFLLVDPLDLSTTLSAAKDVRTCSTSWTELRRQYVPDPYIKALCDAETTSAALQDAGITHFQSMTHGIDLTIDLCPSKQEFEKNFFIELISTMGKEQSPVPIAVAVTGIWMEEHPADFKWLNEQAKNGAISITWINHSYHHRVGKGIELSENFLLKKGTDIDSEILRMEKTLIEHGALPSVFFRFPGLVSNDSVFKKVISYGLIPVGSDAWLCKNQRPKDGSFVLVHGNGNDPVGIQRFFKLLEEEKQNIDNRSWKLFDLRESIIEKEKEWLQEAKPDSAESGLFHGAAGHDNQENAFAP
jgi:hypothetical protein